jgi:hypothetical protein
MAAVRDSSLWLAYLKLLLFFCLRIRVEWTDWP